jgi:hypothetical protein
VRTTRRRRWCEPVGSRYSNLRLVVVGEMVSIPVFVHQSGHEQRRILQTRVGVITDSLNAAATSLLSHFCGADAAFLSGFSPTRDAVPILREAAHVGVAWLTTVSVRIRDLGSLGAIDATFSKRETTTRHYQLRSDCHLHARTDGARRYGLGCNSRSSLHGTLASRNTRRILVSTDESCTTVGRHPPGNPSGTP